MGTPEGERDCVDVANDLLSKCHIKLRLRKLADCHAEVFISLYKNILGEEVPDYVAEPCCQEDDVHNVQSVIDSLSLDYLQISLSHITGENVVRGDGESIKNLVEIFDGLLEYLNEEMNGETQHGVELNNRVNRGASGGDAPRLEDQTSTSSSAESTGHSSKHSLHSCNIEEKGSNAEELQLGVSARTFISKQEDGSSSSGAVDAIGAAPSAVALQPPQQCHGPHVLPTATKQTSDCVVTNGRQSPAESKESSSSRRRAAAEVEGETLEPTNGGPRRVLFRTQPDVLFLTLQEEAASPPDTEEEEPQGDPAHTGRLDKQPRRPQDGSEEPLSYRRQRNQQAEEELQHISEKLSHRLEELDELLKRVLSESAESREVKEDVEQWQHSPPPGSGPPHRSGSSPPPVHVSLQQRCEDVGAEASSPEDGGQGTLCPSRRPRPAHRNQPRDLRNEDFEEELKRLEDRERADVHVARVKAQEAERAYREAMLRDVCEASTPPWAHTEASATPRKAPSLRMKEKQLLPLLREELPHLHISPRALGRMWEQQMQQVERLHSLSSSDGPGRSQVEEVQRKHHLLVELVRKDQEHGRRLKDLKEGLQQQRLTQNRLREQRQQVARARKYHADYHVQHRARLMRARTKEERMFRQLFEEGLELQKVRLRQQRAQAKEQRQERQRRQQDHIQSMENYYRDQFSLLAEKLAQERQEIQVRKKAQEKALLKMQRELRSRMEREIGELQRIIIHNDEDGDIQDLEVQRLRNRLQMASFQFNTSYLH